MADVLGTIGSGIGTAASDIGSGLGQIGGDLVSGAKDVFGGIGNALGGLFGASGGGGPLSPGTIANTASSPAAGVAAAAPASATSAAAFGMPPSLDTSGLAAFDTAKGIDPSALGLPAASAPVISSGLPSVAGVPIPDGSGIGPGIAPNALASGGGMSSFLQSLVNPKTALPLGLLGLDLIHGMGEPAEVKQLKALEAQQAGLANKDTALATAEQEGILPAGGQRLIEEKLRANEAAIRTKYAQMGMSGSSAEAQDLQGARDQALAEQFSVGQQLAATGLSAAQAATGQESSLLSAILAQEMSQGDELGNILADFAGAATK